MAYTPASVETPYYLKKIREDFSRRQRGNRAYSLRAYARDLAVHPSTLSLVILGKRPLPFKDSGKVVDGLSLGAKERTYFMESLGKKHASLDRIKLATFDDRVLLDEETYFQVIAEWEHYAVLTLMDCDGFAPSVDEITKRLSITKQRAGVVLENLVHFGLLKRTETGTLEKAQARVRTSEDVSSQALKASHRETLDISRKKLDELSVELRDFSSMMVAVDPERLPQAKVIIREFRQKMDELLKSGQRSEVYQLAIQFYPLTNPEKQRNPQ